MYITEIVIPVSDIAAMRQFYGDRLALPVENECSSTIDLRVGTSLITFVSRYPTYGDRLKNEGVDIGARHFAFNIPENQIEAAQVWLAARATLISLDGETLFHFPHWNAHAIYCRDPEGNIVELIARHDLANASDQPFSPDSLLCVSEIGLATDEVNAAVRALQTAYDLPIYGSASDSFTALGDENGLLIIVKRGREWYPSTGVQAEVNPSTVTISTPLLLENQAAVKTRLLAATHQIYPCFLSRNMF